MATQPKESTKPARIRSGAFERAKLAISGLNLRYSPSDVDFVSDILDWFSNQNDDQKRIVLGIDEKGLEIGDLEEQLEKLPAPLRRSSFRYFSQHPQGQYPQFVHRWRYFCQSQ